MKARVYIALGTNIGDREKHLTEACSLLDGHAHIALGRVSSVYETEPVGYTEQRQFLNMATELFTDLAPHALLSAMLKIESRLGRKRLIRWGPRKIDLDILLYNQEQVDIPSLQIPHPRMTERAFVLVPLAEIAPDGAIPGVESMAVCIEKSPDKEGVRLWKQNNGGAKFGPFEN